MFCTECGNKLAASARFCGKCGTDSAPHQPAPGAYDQQPPAPGAYDQQPPAPGAYDQQPPMPRAYGQHPAPGTYEQQSGYPPYNTVPNSPTDNPIKPTRSIVALSRKVKIAIVAACTCVALVSCAFVLAQGPLARDINNMFRSDEEIVRSAFRDTAATFSDSVFDEMSDIFGAGGRVDRGSMTVSVSASAAPGAVREIANEFGEFDPFVINMLELLASSELQLRTEYDFTVGREAMRLTSAWNVRELNGRRVSEILSLEYLLVDNAMFLRVPQLQQNYIGLDFGAILNMLGVGGFDRLIEMFISEFMGGMPAQDLAGMDTLLDLFDDNERLLRVMVDDAVEAFFNTFEDVRVENNVTVQVAGRSVGNLNKAVIAFDEYEVMYALAQSLRQVARDEANLRFFADVINAIDPWQTVRPAEIREELMWMIEDLEWGVLNNSRGEKVEVFLYINRSNTVIGAGLRPLDNGEFLEFIFAPGDGFHLLVDLPDDTFLLIYGTLSGRRTVSGEINIDFRDYQTREQFRGRLATFRYSSGSFSATVSGRDIFNLFGDEMYLSRETERVILNMEFELLLESHRNSYGITLTATHLNPQVSVSLHIGTTQGGNVNVSRPADAQVDFINLDMLLRGADIFGLIEDTLNPFALMGNISSIMDELARKGFDLSEFLPALLP